MKITLLRHAEPVEKGICYGHADVKVNEISPAQMQVLQMRWEQDAKPILYTSPSLRCLTLAQGIAGQFTQFVIVDSRLRELHFGEWESRPWSTISEIELAEWGNHWQTARPPQGESFQELCNRVRTFYDEIQEACWIIAHAGSIRVLLAFHQKQDPADFIAQQVPFLEPMEIYKP